MNDNPSFPSLNRVVHEPARLAILSVLSSCASADFVFLQRVTGLSKGNLSVQLTNLEQAGLVAVERGIVDRKTRTTAKLSKRGIAEIEQYWRMMDEIRVVVKCESERRSTSRGRVAPLKARLSPLPEG